MDINGIAQAMTAAYDNTKVNKETEKKSTIPATDHYDGGVAAEYTKSEETTEKKTVKRDTATIEKLMAEAEQRTAQLRSLVEKMLLKQGQKFTSLADTFDMIKEGTLEVDDETATEAAKEVADDGYWGVEQTSERLFSFAKALAGNDPTHADSMLEALQKGFDEATKAWGSELPDICQKTLEAAKEKINNWKEGKTSETKTGTQEASPNITVSKTDNEP